MTSKEVATLWAPHRRLTTAEGEWVLTGEACDILGVSDQTLSRWKDNCPYLDGKGLRTTARSAFRRKMAYFLRSQLIEVATHKTDVQNAPPPGYVTISRACEILGLKARFGEAGRVLRRWIERYDEIKQSVLVKGEKPGHRFRVDILPIGVVTEIESQMPAGFIKRGLWPLPHAAKRLNSGPKRRITKAGLNVWCKTILNAEKVAIRIKNGQVKRMFVLTEQDLADIDKALARSSKGKFPVAALREIVSGRKRIAGATVHQNTQVKSRDLSMPADSLNASADPRALSQLPNSERSIGTPFVPNIYQCGILEKLRNKALTASQLQKAVGEGDRSRLYNQGLNPLRKNGRIVNIKGQDGGYIDLKAPPPKIAKNLV